MKQFKANIKYFRSFFKSKWEFDDYPLEVWKNINAEDKELQYGARFTNCWKLITHGESKKEAIENLKNQFIDFKKNNSKLPRPGANVPLEFSKNIRIEMNEGIAVDFFERIIGINYYHCFVSDLSSLKDFDIEDEETIKKIEKEYEVKLKKGDYYLSDIFEQINEKRNL